MKARFNATSGFVPGIRSLKNADVQEYAAGIVRDKLLNTPMAVEFPGAMRDAGFPGVMAEILRDEALFSRLERRLRALGLDDLLSFYCCGEESLVFTLGTPDAVSRRYVFRISQAYNAGFNRDAEDIPSPMIKPIYHEVLQGGRHGLRLMILPRLREIRASDRRPWRDANKRAMASLGFDLDDPGPQNFMTIPGDPALTPFCMDFGAYSLKPGLKAHLPEAEEGVKATGFTYKGAFVGENRPDSYAMPEFHWKGKMEKAFPVLNISSPRLRLSQVLSEVRGRNIPAFSAADLQAEVLVFN